MIWTPALLETFVWWSWWAISCWIVPCAPGKRNHFSCEHLLSFLYSTCFLMFFVSIALGMFEEFFGSWLVCFLPPCLSLHFFVFIPLLLLPMCFCGSLLFCIFLFPLFPSMSIASYHCICYHNRTTVPFHFWIFLQTSARTPPFQVLQLFEQSRSSRQQSHQQRRPWQARVYGPGVFNMVLSNLKTQCFLDVFVFLLWAYCFMTYKPGA